MLVKLNIVAEKYKNIESFLKQFTAKFKYSSYEENYIFKLDKLLELQFLRCLYKYINDESNHVYSDMAVWCPIELVVSFKSSIMHISVYDNYRE